MLRETLVASKMFSLHPSKQTVGFVPISEIMKWNIEVPTFQRYFDPKHKEHLYDQMRVGFPRALIQPTPIVFGAFQSKLHLPDGQHRLPALMQLYKEYGVDIDVFYTRVECDTAEELFTLFRLANSSRPFSVPSSQLSQEMAKDVAQDFAKRFPRLFKTSHKPKAPHLSINAFVEALGALAPNFSSAMQLARAIDDVNAQCTKLHHMAFGLGHVKHQSLMKNAREKGGFYLGVFLTHDLWVGIAQGTRPAPEKRKKFSAAERVAVWNRDIGADKRVGPCYACGGELQLEKFEMGHIVPLCHGGGNDIPNLRPLCGLCNKSCGTENLDSFKRRITATELPGAPPSQATAPKAGDDKAECIVNFRKLFTELNPVPCLPNGKPDYVRGLSAKAMQDAFTQFAGFRLRGHKDLFHQHFSHFTETAGVAMNGTHTCRVYWYKQGRSQ
jgi:hypothetical protein